MGDIMKGIFYSLMALLLLVPIVSYLIVYSEVIQTQNDLTVQRIEGEKMVSFAKSVDTDLSRALNMYARRAIGNAVSHVANNGSAIDNSNARLRELFFSSTIYGIQAPLNSSVYEWRDKVVAQGRQIGFSTSIDFVETSFVPYDSFNVQLRYAVAVNITFSNANIYRVYNESVTVSVEDYEDTLYTLNTNGLVKNVIKKSPFSVTNVTQLDNLTTERYYIPSDNGASFFDRLEGRLVASEAYKAQSVNKIGMESIVYQPDLLAFGIAPKTSQSFVDYLYFNSSSIPGYPVNDSQISWLKIDTAHATLYGVQLIS